MTTLQDIAVQLSEPFSTEDIDLLPKGKIERDGKTLCMALPYADPRVYQDRLNQLAPGEWETPPPIALAVGDKLVTYVTIVLCGVPHTDVGEASPGENQATEAFAQAFKRAASQFGLGRYLYDLEKEWVPYNSQRKLIDLDKAGKRDIVRKMYQKARLLGQARTQPDAPVERSTPAPAATSHNNGKGKSQTVAEGLDVAPASEQQLTSIRKLCSLMSKPEPEQLTAMAYATAKSLISQMSHEYNESKQSRKVDTANTAKRDVANAPMSPQQLADLKSTFAITFDIADQEVDQRFARWLTAKLQGNATPDTLTVAQYKPLIALLDQHAQGAAQEQAKAS
jgi:hypothetical protein